MKAALTVLLLAQASGAFGQSSVIGDALFSGRLGVGTDATTARVQVLMSTAASTIFQVSGVDETPFLTVQSNGAVGMGVTPAANLDVMGSGDDGSIGLQVRNGNFYPATSALQMTFGYKGKNDLRHAIGTFHSSATMANNGISFYLWRPSVSTTAVGDLNALNLVTTSSSAFVHVMPPAFAAMPSTAALNLMHFVVSNGTGYGLGTIHRASESTHSSRALKTDIRYLTAEDEDRALSEVAGLKHVSFRYMSWRKDGLKRDANQPLRRGLLYEESPQSIRGPGSTISMDERLVNAELALQALMRRLDQAGKDVAAQGGKP